MNLLFFNMAVYIPGEYETLDNKIVVLREKQAITWKKLVTTTNLKENGNKTNVYIESKRGNWNR